MTTKLYNHAFTIAFSVDTDYEGDQVPAHELIEALERRLHDLKQNPDEIIEAVGLPYDSYDNDVPNSVDYIKKENL
jgi:hypothetical protein